MIPIGEAAPDFALPGIEREREARWRLFDSRGRWVVLFFYPADFTFVCPTEIVGFHRHVDTFRKLNVDILGVSVDSVDSHRAWAKELGGIDYPLLSDTDRAVSTAFGVLDRQAGVARRVTFVLDPSGVVAYVVASHHNVGRSVEETLRVVAALQTGRLCPADWHPGEPTSDLGPKY
ncbi:MAG: peroxiredoxin [Nitrospirota bacterium]